MKRDRRRREWRAGKRLALAILAVGLMTISPSPGEDRPARKEGTKGGTDEIKQRIAADYDRLEALYKHLHANPELSLHEARTAARLARELKEIGFDVTEKVGGYGVVGVLKNGDGPTVMVRTDMDALPVVERTNLPYASKVRVRDKNENEVGVMHACGHDMHMTKQFLLDSKNGFG
jgi:hippurate hydrolase